MVKKLKILKLLNKMEIELNSKLSIKGKNAKQ